MFFPSLDRPDSAAIRTHIEQCRFVFFLSSLLLRPMLFFFPQPRNDLVVFGPVGGLTRVSPSHLSKDFGIGDPLSSNTAEMIPPTYFPPSPLVYTCSFPILLNFPAPFARDISRASGV